MRLAAALAVLAFAAAPAAVAAPAKTPAKIAAPTLAEDAVLQQVIAGDWRSSADKARDAYRKPYEAMTFWGLRPGLTVVEVGPGGGWWTEILAPYAARTGGIYVAALGDRGNPSLTPEQRAQVEAGHTNFLNRFGDKARYGEVRTVDFGPRGLQMEPGSADLILVSRAFHNWAQREGLTESYMRAWFAALKPGGVLAVEQHRAPDGVDPTKDRTGYVPESWVITRAEAAGFKLDARSELLANARDTRDHPFGVWTLPPVRRDQQDGRTLTPEERARYDAIGESDRMTLRFRKPG